MKQERIRLSNHPDQIIRSEQIRQQVRGLYGVKFHRNLLRVTGQLNPVEASGEAGSLSGQRTRDDIDLARDVAWALKPDIDAFALARGKVSPEQIEAARMSVATRTINVNASPLVAAYFAERTERKIDRDAITFAAIENDFNRNYENTIELIDRFRVVGGPAIQGAAIEELPLRQDEAAVAESQRQAA